MIKCYCARESKLPLFFEVNWTLIAIAISPMFRFLASLYFRRLSQTKGIIMNFSKLSMLLVISCASFSYAEQVNFGNGSIVTGQDAAVFGIETSAHGDYSAAFGSNTTANGNSSMAFGSNTTASDVRSTAFGHNTKASSDSSTAFGSTTEASAPQATAFGSFTKASGNFSTAFGRSTVADSWGSTAFGHSTQASGEFATAFGGRTFANGRNATAFGYQTRADGYALTAIGRYNSTYPGVDPNSPNVTDPLFIIGNGSSVNNRSNAFTVFANGQIEGGNFIAASITQRSDQYFKENITSSTLGLDEVLSLEAKTYTLIDDEDYQPQVGLIAQEVETVLPELVREDRQGYKSVNYAKLTVVLVEAVKELTAELENITESLCRISPEDPVCQK